MAVPLDNSSSTNTDPKDPKIDPETQKLSKYDESYTSTPAQSNRPSAIDIKSNYNLEAVDSSSTSSTHLGFVQSARRAKFPNNNSSLRSSPISSSSSLPENVEAKMRAFHLSRQKTPTRPLMINHPGPSNFSSAASCGLPASLRLPVSQRPHPQNIASAPILPMVPPKGGLSARRGMKLPGGLPGSSDSTSPSLKMNLHSESGKSQGGNPNSMFNKFSEYVDTKNGILKFAGKAVIHGHGIDFTSGNNFSISLDEVDTLEELGKGNYGTVYKVRHARPRMRRPGLGLAGCRISSQSLSASLNENDNILSESVPGIDSSTSGVVMAMKEIRLELDEAKFAAIIMELDILHRCNSPYIIDFYGAFFQEGAVYICIEYMDGGSIDKIYGNGIPENILKKITYASIQGLKTLKDEHNIIHRDVKPTNILVNTRGQVKICDFGVSGNLVASIAKTNIGCQSYMAPERIAVGGMAQSGSGGSGTYSVQSDIWSLGLTIIESALGRYPYPPETYNNIFSQLSAIVDGEPPTLPKDSFSPQARDFVRGCLNKKPMLRPTYSMLLQHNWLAQFSKPKTISEEGETTEAGIGKENSDINNTFPVDKEVAEWVINSLERKRKGSLANSLKPALHTAPLSTSTLSDTLSPG